MCLILKIPSAERKRVFFPVRSQPRQVFARSTTALLGYWRNCIAPHCVGGSGLRVIWVWRGSVGTGVGGVGGGLVYRAGNAGAFGDNGCPGRMSGKILRRIWLGSGANPCC
jgi:hypothetical protein